MCSFLIICKHLLPNARGLLVYRHLSHPTYPLDQRHSALLFLNRGSQHLYRQFWEGPAIGLRMWLAHNEALLKGARAYPEDTLAVSWDMVRSRLPVEAINKRWDLGLDEVPASEVFDPTVTGGGSGKQPISYRRFIERIEATWQALEWRGKQTERMMEETTI